MKISQKILAAAAIAAGLTLLAGCGDETADDLDRIDAEPTAEDSAGAMEPPADDRMMDPAPDASMEENQGY